MYLFFTANKGLSVIELVNELEINYKQLYYFIENGGSLCSKITLKKILDSLFYEEDVAYIGSKSKK